MVAAVNAHNDRFAVKKIPAIFDDLEKAKRCWREVRLMRHFANHAHIVSLVDLIEPASKDNFEDM